MKMARMLEDDVILEIRVDPDRVDIALAFQTIPPYPDPVLAPADAHLRRRRRDARDARDFHPGLGPNGIFLSAT